MQKTQYGCQPDPVRYMPLPGGGADVWLTKNATQIMDGDNAGTWEADEAYFRTTMSMADVQANFDVLFERGGLLTDPAPTADERITALEEKMAGTQLALRELCAAQGSLPENLRATVTKLLG